MRFTRFATAVAVAAGFCAPVEARWRKCQPTPAPACTMASASPPTFASGLAQAKSSQQAAQGRMAHLGAVPMGHAEGVGYSSSSPQAALANCCFTNSGLPVVEQAVVRGANGWFATKLFGSRPVCINGNCGK